jgi:dTDP-4-amino-4,6-dideoxygalactose transaminase
MIPFFDYRPHISGFREEIDAAVRRVVDSGRVILGPEVEAFEGEFAAWIGARGAVGVNSGTDALTLALRALEIGPNDEVVTVSNAGAPVVAAIRAVGALPRFVDIEPSSLLMDPTGLESALTPRTRCIVPVHLYGRPASIEGILELAERHGIDVIEDCAQAHGARIGDRHVGTYGRVGCFSFYPTKNVGALGDGGMCVSGEPELLERIRALRMYGFDGQRVARLEGINSRLDELQAAVLRVVLSHVDEALEQRQRIAHRYLDGLGAVKRLTLSAASPETNHAYHLFVVRHPERDRLADHLRAERIGSAVHYPLPVHRMPAYHWLGYAAGALPETERACRTVLSLPCFPGLAPDGVERVVRVLSSAALA